MTATPMTEESFESVPSTVSVTKEGLTITLTQDYRERFDTGHYKCCVVDTAGHIVFIGQSIAGAPKGKLGVAQAESILDDFVIQRDRFGR